MEMTNNSTFFMQSQNGEWVKMCEASKLPEFVETAGKNDIAFTIKPRTFSISSTFVVDNRTWAKMRRMFLGFKGHPRTKNLMKAKRLCNGDIHQKGQ